MESLFAELEAWLAEHAPPLRELLNPPASEQEIAAFERRALVTLPPEARALYTIHNGEADGSDGLFGCLRWLPLSEVLIEIDLIGSEGIAPLFRSGGGDLLYVRSYNPATPDARLYEWWHEVPEEAEVVAESLGAYLAQFVADLRAGRYVYRPNELTALIDRNEM